MRCLVAIAFAGAIMTALPAFSQTTSTTRGYTNRNGTYVEPYVRTNPNSSTFDNFSTRGNSNPYTGRQGTVDPYAAPRPRTYR